VHHREHSALIRRAAHTRHPTTAILALLVVGCSSQTQLIVAVDTDLTIPGRLDGLRVEVRVAEQTMIASGELTSHDALPQTLGVSGAGAEEVRVVAVGLLAGTEVVRQERVTRFVSGQSRLLPLELAESCVGVSCGEAQTCRRGECVASAIAPSALARWEGHEPERFVGPPSDAGGVAMDAGESPPNDAGSIVTDRFCAVAAGGRHTCATTDSGTAYCWGANESGQLGDGTTGDRRQPVAVTGLPGAVVFIAAGSSHTCGLVAGTVWCWGANASGQLGNRATSPREPTPVQVVREDGSPLTDALGVAAGTSHTCARTAGEVLCWGENTRGQLGDATTSSKPFAVGVDGLAHVAAIAVGDAFSCALLTGAVVQCWGDNSDGQLGATSPSSRPVPRPVPGLSDATVLGVGGAHVCAVTESQLLCWGANDRGQLGDGTNTGRANPAPTDDLPSATELALGAAHSCAVGTGMVRCWGAGSAGQLGGDNTDATSPRPSSGLAEVAVIATGTAHTCAVTRGGRLYCWGANDDGRLGDGSSRSSATPVEVVHPP